jgi:prepilin-type processing-associated H-X9-DG protein
MPNPPTPEQWWNVMSFRSKHPGGASFCYADGSVNFINESVNYMTYRAMCTRSGKEPLTITE